MPGSAPIRVTCDGRYALWINGVEVLRGPARSAPHVMLWDEVDLGRHLRAGPNILAAAVRHYAVPVPQWLPTPPYAGLGQGGPILESRDLPELSTSRDWAACRPAWRAGPKISFNPGNEHVDARRVAKGWRTDPGTNGWHPVVELRPEGRSLPEAPFTVVYQNPLPAPKETVLDARLIGIGPVVGNLEGPQWPFHGSDPDYARDAAVRAERPGSEPLALAASEGAIFDFGAIVYGLVEVEVEAAPGTVVDLRASEALKASLISDRDRQWLYRYTCRGSDDRLEPFEAIGLRYLSLIAEGDVRDIRVRLRERLHDRGVGGAFECDDPQLGELWSIGTRTLDLCSTDAFLDCPSREQRAWLGDAYVHSLLTYVSASSTALAKRALVLAAEEPRSDGLLPMVAAGDMAHDPVTHPDYSLHWISALARCLEYTGDLDLVRGLLPAAGRILDWFWQYVRDDRLERIPDRPFVDWTPVPRHAATIQGLYTIALSDHAGLCDALSWPVEAAHSRERADLLRRGLHAYRDDSGDWREEPAGVRSQHALAVAIIAGAVSPEEASALLERAVDPEVVRYPQRGSEDEPFWVFPADFDPARHVIAAQPFFAHWLHQAMATVHRRDLLLDSVSRWLPFLATGDGSIWECWGDQSAELSHAHAWGATPTYDLTTHILGIRPGAPGFAQVEISPWFGRLSRLSGHVTTPRGRVQVELELADGPRGFIEPLINARACCNSKNFPLSHLAGSVRADDDFVGGAGKNEGGATGERRRLALVIYDVLTMRIGCSTVLVRQLSVDDALAAIATPDSAWSTRRRGSRHPPRPGGCR